MSRRWSILLSAVALAVLGLPRAASAQPPALVQAFVDGLARQCGGEMTPAVAEQVVQRLDLNGDQIDDWIVDASAFPCPKRPVAFADQGALITVFLGTSDGLALPALQKAGFGAHLERNAEGGQSLMLTLAGGDCAADGRKIRCERKVRWVAGQGRLDLAPISGAPKTPIATHRR